MTGVFRRSAADDDCDTSEVGERIAPAERWLEAMDRRGAALERGDADEVDRLVRQSRATRGQQQAVDISGAMPTPTDPMLLGGADS